MVKNLIRKVGIPSDLRAAVIQLKTIVNFSDMAYHRWSAAENERSRGYLPIFIGNFQGKRICGYRPNRESITLESEA